MPDRTFTGGSPCHAQHDDGGGEGTEEDRESEGRETQLLAAGEASLLTPLGAADRHDGGQLGVVGLRGGGEARGLGAGTGSGWPGAAEDGTPASCSGTRSGSNSASGTWTDPGTGLLSDDSINASQSVSAL